MINFIIKLEDMLKKSGYEDWGDYVSSRKGWICP